MGLPDNLEVNGSFLTIGDILKYSGENQIDPVSLDDELLVEAYCNEGTYAEETFPVQDILSSLFIPRFGMHLKGSPLFSMLSSSAVVAMEPYKDCISMAVPSFHLILCSNFRLYAYNSTELCIDLISRFAEVQVVLSNLIMAVITRESVYAALDAGLSPQDIVGFLKAHIHPIMKKKVSTGDISQAIDQHGICTNVSLQIFLWGTTRVPVQFRRCIFFQWTPTEIDICIRRTPTYLDKLRQAIRAEELQRPSILNKIRISGENGNNGELSPGVLHASHTSQAGYLLVVIPEIAACVRRFIDQDGTVQVRQFVQDTSTETTKPISRRRK